MLRCGEYVRSNENFAGAETSLVTYYTNTNYATEYPVASARGQWWQPTTSPATDYVSSTGTRLDKATLIFVLLSAGFGANVRGFHTLLTGLGSPRPCLTMCLRRVGSG